jgi:lysophospholipase L1-like esterase
LTGLTRTVGGSRPAISHFLDINDDLPRSLIPDGVHPTANGYQIWANAMQPALDALWNG